MESIWTDTAALPRYKTLSGDIVTDVLVIGGGMAGLLCGRLLTDAGVNCIIVEANRIGCGITKNTTAKITSQHGLIYHKLWNRFGPEVTELYLQANEQALSAYHELCSGIPCDYQEQDNYIYSLDDPGALEAELRVLEALHYPAAFAQELPLPFPTAGAIRFPSQAQFHPLKFLMGILPGLTIYENTAVRELMPHCAITDLGRITAGSIIVATHFPILNKHGSFFLKQYQQRSYVLALKNAPALTGMYLDAAENGLSFRTWGDSLLLGGGGHRTGKPGGGWELLEGVAREYFPGAQITHRWATQDCMTLDGLPYIGRYSRHTQGLYVATGFNKWGMTSSMVAAQLLTELITTWGSPYQQVFSPSRSMLHPQLAANALEATKNLLSLSPRRCPHMGCALKWNPQEHSWDCPCHGSRFQENGKLIDNPATGDLKKQK